MTPIEQTLYQQAIQEVQTDNQWSLDRLAYELHSDPVTVKRFLNKSEPENINQERHLTKLLANIDAYLITYVRPLPKKIDRDTPGNPATNRKGRQIIQELLDRDLVGVHIARLMGVHTGVVTKWRTGSFGISPYRLRDLERVQRACQQFPDLYGAELAMAARQVLEQEVAA